MQDAQARYSLLGPRPSTHLQHLRSGRARPRDGACACAPRRVAGDPGTQHARGPGRGGTRVSRHTGHRTRGAWARGLAARRTSRASWPVSGSHFLRSLPPTSRPALRQSPSARDTTAVDPRSPAHSRSRPARSLQLTCLAPPTQASSAPPRPGTEDSPQPQPIARRAGIGGGSDANVRQSQARLLKLQTNGKATDPPRPARGGGKGGTCGVSGRGGRAGTGGATPRERRRVLG